MKTLQRANTSNETSTGDRQGVNHTRVPLIRPVSVFPGSIPLIQRKAFCACDGGCPRCSGIIQPKLTVGAPNDKYEQEADRVADQVMRMPDPVVQRSAGCSSCGDLDEDQIQTKSIGDQITPLIQRQEDAGIEEESEEEEEEPVQPKSISNKSPPVTTGLGHRIQSMRGGGQPLSASTRAFFEPRFDRDFSRVRVHNDSTAAALARSVNARAFTLGTNIVFNTGSYVPGTAGGRRLLAHELTHVVQQRNGLRRLQRTEDNIVSCNRTGARACLIHLHNSERVALEVAKDLFCRYCTNLVYIDSGRRCRMMRFEVGSHTCCVDPNRLFDLDLIDTETDENSTESYMPARIEWNQKWDEWNSNSCNCEEECRSEPLRTQAFEVARRKSRELRQAIDNCRGQAETQDAVDTQTLPVVAFHGNTATNVGRGQRTLSICSYCRGNGEWGATEQNPVNYQGNPLATPNNCCITTSSTTAPFLNPHIVNGQDVDDFILVTRPEDFYAYAHGGRNVVLQSANPPRDGSLSVALGSGRYINIEAQRPFSVSEEERDTSRDLNERRTGQQARDIQHTMGSDTLSQVLGLSPGGGECPAAPTTGCPNCESLLTTTRQTTPPHTPPQCPVSTESDCQNNPGGPDEENE